MDDRELLELAAKAAGIYLDDGIGNGGRGDKFDLVGNAVLDWHNGITWNPLKDDGDALRLAMDLGISIKFDEWNKQALASTIDFICYEEAKTVDRYKAARRAIVRVAAEMILNSNAAVKEIEK